MDLRSQWCALWDRLGATGDGAAVGYDLLRRYAEAGREYHTSTHLAQCLAELDSVRQPAANLDVLEYALWFHDAVYDPRAHDNEERSAELAQVVARRAGLAEEFGERVARLILATKHTGAPETAEEAVMVDVDLSILGQSEAQFAAYEDQIRMEYMWVPWNVFAKGRAAILSSIFERPHVYATEAFRAKYEEQARENLARSITTLRDGPGVSG